MIKLEENENIVLEIRKHWFILFFEALFLVLLILVSVMVFFGAENFSVSRTVDWQIKLVVASTWFLFIWIIFFIVWTDYYLDIFIITNKRIIDMEQKGLFSREISTLRLDRIQDVKVEVHGLIATLLKFGNINIQTAGEEKEFVLKGLPQPYKIKEAIMAEYDKAVEKMRTVKIEK